MIPTAITDHHSRARRPRRLDVQALVTIATVLLVACGKAPEKPAPAPLDVTTIVITPGDVPVAAGYVAQTQSSQAVNIQAQVSGFVDERTKAMGGGWVSEADSLTGTTPPAPASSALPPPLN